MRGHRNRGHIHLNERMQHRKTHWEEQVAGPSRGLGSTPLQCIFFFFFLGFTARCSGSTGSTGSTTEVGRHLPRGFIQLCHLNSVVALSMCKLYCGSPHVRSYRPSSTTSMPESTTVEGEDSSSQTRVFGIKAKGLTRCSSQ